MSRPVNSTSRRRALAALGTLCLPGANALAEIRNLTRLPRPTIEGTWRVERLDESDLVRPIVNFHFSHFDPDYLPVGTTLTFRSDGAWGSAEPERESVELTFHAPFSREIAGKNGDNVRHFLADRDGNLFTKDRRFSGYLTLGLFKDDAILGSLTSDYLRKLGYRDGALYYWYQGEGVVGTSNYFIPNGPDELITPSWYAEMPGKDRYAPEDCTGPVAIVLKRVNKGGQI